MDAFALLARYYDAEHANLTEDISLYTNFAERTGGPLLELGSGTGRLTAALARAGYSITGIDHSPEMLAIAGQTMPQEPQYRSFTPKQLILQARHFTFY